MSELAACPFCASSEVKIIGKRRARVIACENCLVEVRPPGWRVQTDADIAAFWNRCRRPGAHTLDPYLVSGGTK
jgi:ribosomal protein L37AE/L43A